ncbi:hypothetical protein MTO96_035645 [Rhipicephalus appendiculatus]
MLDEGMLCASAKVHASSSLASGPRRRHTYGPSELESSRSSRSLVSGRSYEPSRSLKNDLALPSVASGVGGYVGIRRRFVFGGDADLF